MTTTKRRRATLRIAGQALNAAAPPPVVATPQAVPATDLAEVCWLQAQVFSYQLVDALGALRRANRWLAHHDATTHPKGPEAYRRRQRHYGSACCLANATWFHCRLTWAALQQLPPIDRDLLLLDIGGGYLRTGETTPVTIWQRLDIGLPPPGRSDDVTERLAQVEFWLRGELVEVVERRAAGGVEGGA